MYKRRESVGPARLRMFYRSRFNPMVAMVIVVAAISILSWDSKARLTAGVDRTSTSPNPQPLWVSQSNQRENAPLPTNIQVETFTVGLDGFAPKRINRRPGPFVLGIDNYTRFRNASFELVREDGSKVHEIKWPSGRVRHRQLINLPRGNYLLKEANHPDWTAQITIGK